MKHTYIFILGFLIISVYVFFKNTTNYVEGLSTWNSSGNSSIENGMQFMRNKNFFGIADSAANFYNRDVNNNNDVNTIANSSSYLNYENELQQIKNSLIQTYITPKEELYPTGARLISQCNNAIALAARTRLLVQTAKLTMDEQNGLGRQTAISGYNNDDAAKNGINTGVNAIVQAGGNVVEDAKNFVTSPVPPVPPVSSWF